MRTLPDERRAEGGDPRPDPGSERTLAGSGAGAGAPPGPGPGDELAGRYRIERELGRGGMGRVFAAWDPKLARRVAIKVLTAGAHRGPALERFEQEARAAGALNHPNVVAVHDAGSWRGEPFLVSELLEGETLRERLSRGPLPVEEAIGLALQLAEGLAAAHEKGIVHRDLKPENVFRTREGRLKILDFGIAKLLSPQEGGDGAGAGVPAFSTATGVVLGTPRYMSPEQLRGEAVDARTDLFSLGAILYELLAGRMAFEARTPAEAASAVLTATPPPLPRSVPSALEALVARCLEKDARRRPASAAEVAAAMSAIQPQQRRFPSLRTSPFTRRRPLAPLLVVLAVLAAGLVIWQRPQALAPLFPALFAHRIGSLAVLPLRNLSGDAAQEYFADGMTDELIARLARIGSLRVISRTSAMLYKEAKKPLRQIAKELGVDVVVEGSVLASGDRIRLTAQLLDGGTEKSLWTETYDRRLADVITLQNELARTVAGEIRAKVTPEEARRLESARQVDPEAWRLYLAGRQLSRWLAWTSADGAERPAKAVTAFKEALARDPGLAPAWAALAYTYALQALYVLRPSGEAFADARAAATKALALDEDLGEAHAALALVKLMFDWDWAGAEKEVARALELDASSEDARDAQCQLLVALGRWDEAVAAARKGIEAAPMSTDRQTQLAWVLFYARRYDESIAQFKKVLFLDPKNAVVLGFVSVAHVLKGAIPEALEAAGQQAALSPPGGNSLVDSFLVATYSRGGRRVEARAIVDLWEARAQKEPVDPGTLATLHAWVGDTDRAFALLDKSVSERSIALYTLKTDPFFDPLRGDPRFAGTLARLNLPP